MKIPQDVEQNNKLKQNQQMKNSKTKIIQAQRLGESKNLKQTLDFESSKRGWWTLETLSLCTKVQCLSLVPNYVIIHGKGGKFIIFVDTFK